jgi:hypothetical protein
MISIQSYHIRQFFVCTCFVLALLQTLTGVTTKELLKSVQYSVYSGSILYIDVKLK